MDTDNATADRDRWMAWGGLAFLLIFLAAMIASGDDISEDATGKEVLAAVSGHKDGSYIAVFLYAPAVAALCLFGARFRSLLSPVAGAARQLFQYGLLLYAASLTIGAVLDLALVAAQDHGQEQVAETVNVLSNDFWIPMTIGTAILLIGAGLSVLRTALLPRWMGWVALVVGVISLLGPGGFAGFFVTPIWIAIAGVMLAVRKDAPAVA